MGKTKNQVAGNEPRLMAFTTNLSTRRIQELKSHHEGVVDLRAKSDVAFVMAANQQLVGIPCWIGDYREDERRDVTPSWRSHAKVFRPFTMFPGDHYQYDWVVNEIDWGTTALVKKCPKDAFIPVMDIFERVVLVKLTPYIEKWEDNLGDYHIVQGWAIAGPFLSAGQGVCALLDALPDDHVFTMNLSRTAFDLVGEDLESLQEFEAVEDLFGFLDSQVIDDWDTNDALATESEDECEEELADQYFPLRARAVLLNDKLVFGN